MTGDELREAAQDFRRMMPRFTADNAVKNAELLDRVGEIAQAHSATPAQIALAWLHSCAATHGLPVIPIPGTWRRTRVEENTAAAGLKLSDTELAQLGRLANLVAGDRYGDMSFSSAGRE
ncbi:aldo/keto reductase [Nonomuraea angiospora]|uniref:aldo/keto reductase n=1 Tax=Nonomuraea angiospora TaxID=46172 RepID=UPI00344CF111